MKKIILILLGIAVLNFKPQEASALFHFRPLKPTIRPRPTIVIPTWPSRKWFFRPTNTPTPTSTPTLTPTPTATPTPRIIESQGMLKFQTPPISRILVSDTLDIKLLVNTDGVQIINIDGLVIYDPTKVTINYAQTGNFLTYFAASPLGGSTNKYLLSSWEESVTHAKSSSTDTLWATINVTFKEKGDSSFLFDCTQGSESDSNINRSSDSQDILNCPLIPLNLIIE